MIICYICRQKTPDLFKAEHHVKPQAAGGTKQDELPLCGGCHDNLHRVAQMISSNKSGKAITAVELTYAKDPGAQKRIIDLANKVVYWMQQKKEGNAINSQDRVKVDIPFYLTIQERKALKTLASECKSQTKFIEGLVKREIYKRFPKLIK